MVLERGGQELRNAVSPFTSPRIAMEKQATAAIETIGWENLPIQNADEFVIVPDTNDNLVVAQRSVIKREISSHMPVDYLKDMCRNVCYWFPDLAERRVIRSWITPVPFVPDRQPFWGRVQPYENLVIASGFCSVLIMAPVIGETNRMLLLGQKPQYQMEQFLPNRFERGVDKS